MILVFGADGLIGTYLMDELKRRGRTAIGADIRPVKGCLQIDVTSGREIRDSIFLNKFSAVINLACAQPATAGSDFDPVEYIKVNSIGTLNLLEFCKAREVKKYIQVMSLKTPGVENEFTIYAISELAARECIRHYSELGQRAVILRVPPVYGYGPHMVIFRNGKIKKTACQIFIECAQKCLPLEVYGDWRLGRYIVYVKDVVNAIIKSIEIEQDELIYNVIPEERISLKEQAEITARVFWGDDSEPMVVNRPDIPNGIEKCYYAKCKDFAPEYTFEEMMIDIKKEMEIKHFKFEKKVMEK